MIYLIRISALLGFLFVFAGIYFTNVPAESKLFSYGYVLILCSIFFAAFRAFK